MGGRFHADAQPIIRLLEDYGGWKRTHGKALGWGGAIDWAAMDKSGRGDRVQGAHSDPVASEVAAALAAGQGIFQFLDSRIAEDHPQIVLLMRMRYVARSPWADIARKINWDEDECREAHRRVCGRLTVEVRQYVRTIIWDYEAESHTRGIAQRKRA